MPGKYSEALVEQLCRLAIQGYTVKQCAEACGITEQALYMWRREKPEFKGKFDAARDAASSAVVEASLFKRATGYQYTKELVGFDKKSGEFKRETQLVEVVPDVKAAEFWLTNREPERWKPQTGKLDATLKLEQGPAVQVMLPDNFRAVQAELEQPATQSLPEAVVELPEPGGDSEDQEG